MPRTALIKKLSPPSAGQRDLGSMVDHSRKAVGEESPRAINERRLSSERDHLDSRVQTAQVCQDKGWACQLSYF